MTERTITLQGGLFDGRVIDRPLGCHTIVLPAMEVGGRISSHSYSVPEGRWLHSETFVGFESDETIAKRAAFGEWMYWDSLEAESDGSFV